LTPFSLSLSLFPLSSFLRAIADALDCPVPPFVQPEEVTASALAEN
jgi:hypothetical protein